MSLPGWTERQQTLSFESPFPPAPVKRMEERREKRGYGERESKRVGWREGQREREKERILSRLHTQHGTQLRARSRDPEIMT